MKRKVDLISVKKALEDAFYLGIRLGFAVGEFADRVSPKVVGRRPKEIQKIWRKEVDAVFKEFEKEALEKFGT